MKVDGAETPLHYTQNGTKLAIDPACAAPDEIRSVVRVDFAEEPRYVPAGLVELENGRGSIDQNHMFWRNSANRSYGTVRLDSYFVDRTGKDYEDVQLTASGDFKDSVSYRISFGERSMVLTGAQLKAGPFGEGLTMKANTVTRASIELANPAYYAHDVDLYGVGLAVEAYESASEAIAPAMRHEPEDVETKPGKTAVFVAAASGRPAPTYQWYRVAPGASEGVALEGETSPTLKVLAEKSDDGAGFYAVATNPEGSATTRTAKLTVTDEIANLALDKPASQSSTSWNGLPGRANDGVTDGVWDNGSVSHTDLDTNPWWQVDLEKNRALGEVRVWNRAASDDCSGVSCAKRLEDFWVVASKEPIADGVDPASLVDSDEVKAIEVEGVGGYPSRVDFDGFEARYVRVIQPGTYRPLALAEVEVFAKKAPVGVAPTVSAIEAEPLDEGDFSMAGDAQSRTITTTEGMFLQLKADVAGDPEPEVKWMVKKAGQNEWTPLEEGDASIVIVEASKDLDGAIIRLEAKNSAGTATSGLIELKVTEPAPTPDPGETPAPTPDPKVSVDKSAAAVGEEIVITGTGFIPGHEIEASLHSDPIRIGTAPADAKGEVSFRFTIPSGLAVGAHSVVLVDKATNRTVKASILIGAQNPAAPEPQEKPEPNGAAPTAPYAPSAPAKPATTAKTQAGAKGKGPLAATGADSILLVGTATLFAAAGALALFRRKR